MPAPDFIVIGAAKSGTTSLYHQLGAHPQLHMSPVREPSYFAVQCEQEKPADDRRTLDRSHWVRDADSYQRLFDGAPDDAMTGEISPMYMAVPQSASRIAEAVPEAKIIAVLRQPVERAYSAFLHLRRDGREPCERFEDALAAETERRRDGWGFLWRYRELGEYRRQLEPFFEAFPRRQIQVVLYEEYAERPAFVLSKLFDFLQVDTQVAIDLEARHNVSGEPRSARLAAALRPDRTVGRWARSALPRSIRQRVGALTRRVNTKRPTLPNGPRDDLRQAYEPDSVALSRLTGVDVSNWWRRTDTATKGVP